MATIERFEDLEVWRESRAIVSQIYTVTRSVPFSKDYGLRDQLRRAAVSIPSNITEGFERGGRSEFSQFLSIAKGSAGEVKTQLFIALDLGYVSSHDFSELTKRIEVVAKKIGNLMRYLSDTEIRGPKFKRGTKADRDGVRVSTRNPKPETRNQDP